MSTAASEGLDQALAALADRYDLVREIGRGGMAVVWLARDRKHDRDVAIKILRPELVSLLGTERFLHEIQIESRLQHPHILPLHDSGDAGGLPYYVMPFVEGQSLRHRLIRERQLPLEEALAVARDVAEALEYAHANGVIHRDVKPENILLTGDHALVADFGIARAVSAAGSHELTSSGFVLGTPAYMSPEQADLGAPVDGRSDLYALGCVVYEMLAGEPPFTGATVQSVIARQLGEPPRSLRVVRPSVPEHVERAVGRALAKVPADRFAGTREFIGALAAPAPRMARRTRGQLLAGAGIMGIAALTILATLGGGTKLDPTRYVLAPISGPGGDPDSVRQSVWGYEFESALQRAPDISLHDTHAVHDRLRRAGSGAHGLSAWLEMSRDLGVGRTLVLRTVLLDDSIAVVAEIYDVSRGTSLRSERERVPASTVSAGPYMARLVERLFRLPRGAITVAGTKVADAARAYASGRKAVESWDLAGAAAWFEEALRLDREYADAYLWLAKARAWADEPAVAWIGAARNAVGRESLLADGESRGAARALLAMAERQFPRACGEYERMIAADSLSFEAWYGLGECRRRDHVVVRDEQSPSRWRFRSSYHAAMLAYRRALEIVPSFNFAAFSRMPDVLFAEPGKLRAGRPLAPDTGQFRAYPSLSADTLGFLPYRAADVLAARPGTYPASLGAAIQRNRALLQTIALGWAEAFPDSARPRRELALALELTGRLDASQEPDLDALTTSRRAEAAARNGLDSVLARVQSIRLLLKLQRFAEASVLADSTLSSWTSPEPVQALNLAGLAVLVGRPIRASQLAFRGASALPMLDPDGRIRGAPLALLQNWRALEPYAALGAPIDSERVYAVRLERSLAAAGGSHEALGWGCGLLWPTLGLAFGELGRVAPSPACRQSSTYLEMQYALARGDSTAVRGRFTEILQARRSDPPGDLAPQFAFLEASAVLAAGDTASAVRHLDAMLASIPSLRTTILFEPSQAGGLVRAMVLRADLAAVQRDRESIARWARAVTALWDRSEPELQVVVRRMRLLAQD